MTVLLLDERNPSPADGYMHHVTLQLVCEHNVATTLRVQLLLLIVSGLKVQKCDGRNQTP